MRRLMASAVAVACVAGGPALAGATVRKGVSKSAKATLARVAQRNTKRLLAARMAKVRRFQAAVERDLKRELAAVEGRLKQDRRFAAFKRQLDALRQPGKSRGANGPANGKQAEARRKAVVALFKRNRGVFAEAVRKAGVTERGVRSVVTRRARATLGAQTQVRSLDASPFVSLIILILDDLKLDASPPKPTRLCLSPPYAESDKSTDAQLVEFLTAEPAPAEGTYDVQGHSLYFGHGDSRAVVGDFVSVPAGYTRLKVSCKVRASHNAFAISLGGIAFAGNDLVVELSGTDNQTYQAAMALDFVVSPIAYYAESNDEGTKTVTHTFAIPSTGGEFLVTAGGHGWCTATAHAISDFDNEGSVREICVEALP